LTPILIFLPTPRLKAHHHNKPQQDEEFVTLAKKHGAVGFLSDEEKKILDSNSEPLSSSQGARQKPDGTWAKKHGGVGLLGTLDDGERKILHSHSHSDLSSKISKTPPRDRGESPRPPKSDGNKFQFKDLVRYVSLLDKGFIDREKSDFERSDSVPVVPSLPFCIRLLQELYEEAQAVAVHSLSFSLSLFLSFSSFSFFPSLSLSLSFSLSLFLSFLFSLSLSLFLYFVAVCGAPLLPDFVFCSPDFVLSICLCVVYLTLCCAGFWNGFQESHGGPQ